MALRLGDVLVARGVLTASQRDVVLHAQSQLGRPFGVLAEELYDICPRDVEKAWAQQYASLAPTLTAGEIAPDSRVLELLDRRQAWQFELLPLRVDAPGELVFCTTERKLPKALRFVNWRFAQPCLFMIASVHDLGISLERHYPLGGVKASELTKIAG